MGKSLDEMTEAERARLFPIILTEHKPVWKKRYLKEKPVIERAVGAAVIVRVNHIGSTVVPGLISKPTIDVLVEIKENADITALKSSMEGIGYRCLERTKPPMTFIKGYTEKGFRGQAFHVHVKYSGDLDELYFRDYLLAHPDIATKYGRLKQKLKLKYEYDRDAYTDAKTKFITRITRLARAETQKR